MADLTRPLFNQSTTELLQTPGEEIAPPRLPVVGVPRPPQPKRNLLWIGLVVVAIAVPALWMLVSHQRAGTEASSSATLHTANVEKRDFVRTLRLTGTVEAVQAYSIAAPRLMGAQVYQLTITKLIPPGTKVKKGDLLVEFDRQDQIKNSMDRKADYISLVDQIQKKKADQANALAQDQTALKQAEDALLTAQLEMRKNEVISHIDAEKNKENLEQAEAALKQLRQTFDLKRLAAAADLKDLEIQRDRNRDAMLFATHNAEKLSIHSPADGLAVLNNIWKGNGMGEVQEGDQVRPGLPFLQVVNPNSMEVKARVNQADIGFLKLGQPLQMQLDAYPGLVFSGSVGQIAAIGESSTQSDNVHYFSVTFSVRGNDPRLMPDLSAAVDVEIERIPDSLVVPRDAVRVQNDQPYVSVKNGTSFEKRPVKIGPMSDMDAVIDTGVDAGAVVLRGANP